MSGVLVGCDVGGTFTDAILLDPATGDRVTAKAPTTPPALAEGVVAAIGRALDAAGAAPGEVDRVVHGTTTATNALLEDELAPTALVTNAGFEDVLEIGRQTRPSLYDLAVTGPEPIVPRTRRFGITARLAHDATELEPVDEAALDALAEDLVASDARAVAVCLLHSHRAEAHEARVAERLREALDASVHVVASHEVNPEVREVERFTTTVVNAALAPRMDAYLARLDERLAQAGFEAPVRILDSAGGLVDPAEAAALPVRLALSGPAGGVAAMRWVSQEIETPSLLGVDMGGTSTDVSLVLDGEPTQRWETEVAGRRLQLPAADVHTVGAGGGSIAWLDDAGGLRVGPASAGASPGPACYGQGGDAPTLTDANLVLDRLPPGTRLGGELELDRAAAERVLGELADAAGEPVEAMARGVLEVARAHAVRGIRVLAARHAVDPQGLTLAAFGGAGPQFGAAWAHELGIPRIVVPRDAGVTSAAGLLAAPPRVERSRSVLEPLEKLHQERLADVAAPLERAAEAALGVPASEVEHRVSARYEGQSHELTVRVDPLEPQRLRERFEAAHEEHHGYRLEGTPVEVVTVRARAVADPALAPSSSKGTDKARDVSAEGHIEAFFPGPGERRSAGIVDEARLAPGHRLEGPLVVRGEQTTVLVPPGWKGQVHESGHLVLAREGSA